MTVAGSLYVCDSGSFEVWQEACGHPADNGFYWRRVTGNKRTLADRAATPGYGPFSSEHDAVADIKATTAKHNKGGILK
jgi:hypothetical protein